MPTRREALGAFALVTGALPVLGQQHQHAAGDAGAAFLPPRRAFTEEEFRTLTRLVDLIIPPTETPGAAQAGVPNWIDATVAAPGDKRLAALKQGLATLDRAAQKQHKKPFADLTEEQQAALLTPISQQAKSPQGRFFQLAKDLTIDLYYTSEAGLVQELGYQGNTALAEFKGCTHPEHKA